jgi:TolB protein
MDPDGSNLVNLTNHEAWDSDPAWSPDSNEIAFLSSRAGRLRLCVMNSDGSDVREVLNRDQSGWTFPAWSPDGKQLLFTDRHDDGSWHVFVVNTDGKGLQKISDEAGYNVWPAWSPDARYVAYVNYNGQPGRPGSEHGRLVIRDLIEETPTPPALAALQCGARPAWKPRRR